MKLYEINEQLERLLMLEDGNAVDEETGEVFSPEQIDSLYLARDEKIEGCLLFVKNQQEEADAIKNEIKALQERVKACEKRATRTKEYVSQMLAGDKFSSSRVKVSYRKNTVCEVAENTTLPEEFQRITIEPNKIKLKEFLKNGGVVQGVSLVNKQSMIIS